ncbi:MAG: deoxyribodipyrimidine photo-lyase, partial [Parafilimonas terrae]|nr:deoxyribodipyrimidine photo-lyase [Parafilimonas terrae]
MAIQGERIRVLNDVEPEEKGAYVLYLLQQANRARFNHALEFAIDEANRLKLPVVACFGLLDGENGFPEANARHYAFLLQGLAEAKAGLEKRGIAFVMRKASPAEVAIALAKDAALLVLDRGYLAIQKHWYGQIQKRVKGRIVQVEGDVVVPVETASGKHEYGARTLRPKLHKVWEDYLEPLATRPVKHRADHIALASDIDVSDPDGALGQMHLDTRVGPVRRFKGGEREAMRRLKAYL